MSINRNGPLRPIYMVSNSEISAFKGCRRKWNLSSFNRRNLIPKIPNFKLWVGTAGHYALERWHGYGEDPVEAFENWTDKHIAKLRDEVSGRVGSDFWDKLDDIVDLGRGILRNYQFYAEKHILPIYTFVEVELEFAVPIPGSLIYITDQEGNFYDWVTREWGQDPFGHENFKKWYGSRGLVYESQNNSRELSIPALYVGRLDALVRDNKDDLWVLDHKFMASLVDPELLNLDEQTAKYVWAAQQCMRNGWWPAEYGDLVKGAIYNVIRKKIPQRPAILTKSGTTSKSKIIDTTEEIFLQHLTLTKENPEDFKDVLNHLRGKGNRFFQTMRIHRGVKELEALERRLGYEYNDLANVAAVSNDIMHPVLYPSPRPECKWKCSFKNLCYVANFGGDVEGMIGDTMENQKRTDLYATQVEDLGDEE